MQENKNTKAGVEHLIVIIRHDFNKNFWIFFFIFNVCVAEAQQQKSVVLCVLGAAVLSQV